MESKKLILINIEEKIEKIEKKLIELGPKNDYNALRRFCKTNAE